MRLFRQIIALAFRIRW